MNEYGLTRLVLLNSAGYERAEIPLDDSVSIIGPNNAGKTSLINALQFLLIRDRRQMDFGAHDENNTLKFYFPTTSSFILLEAQLESGMVVLGCVGKGVSREYRHFAYEGSLRIEDYRTENGRLASEADLREHLSTKERTVHYFPRSSEFFDALYGRFNTKSSRRFFVDSDLDLRLYRLENSALIPVFQQILVRTLRLDKLQADDVKKFLLKIFAAEYGTEIDFNKIWHRAFDQVNQDRQQYQACRRLEERILNMGTVYEERMLLRGKISALRPQIDTALTQWEDYRTKRQAALENEKQQFKLQLDKTRREDDVLVEERSTNKLKLDEYVKLQQRQQALESEFVFLSIGHGKEQLEEERGRISQELAEARVLLQSSKQDNLPRKQREQKQREQELENLQNQLEFGEQLLGAHLQKHLSPAEMDLLFGLARESVLNLKAAECGNPERFVQKLKTLIAQNPEYIDIAGLTLQKKQITVEYRVKSPEELRHDIRFCRQQLITLEKEIQALKDRDAQEKIVADLQDKENQARQNVECYAELLELRANCQSRTTAELELTKRQNQIECLRNEILRTQDSLREKQNQVLQNTELLNRQNQNISTLKNQRRDHGPYFQNIEDLPHTPWYSSEVLTVERLEEALRAQTEDCRRLEEIDRRLKQILSDTIQNGFTKFSNIAEEDKQIELILNYTNNLDKEDATLQKAVRTAVTSVASSLKELERQFTLFQSRLQDFNQLIGRRKLSDLERFRIELREHPYLLDAIRTILSSSDAIENLENPDLFDMANAQDNSIGDDDLDKAKDRLLKFSNSEGSLKLDHLFDLEFEVAKIGQNPQRFDQLDKIGSNGTVLMAKLISGLALLFQMQDSRHKVNTVCYLDEAASLDDANQASLISTAREFGFNLLFASPTPQNTVRYCVPIEKRNNKNLVTRMHWQIFEELEA